jgi:cell division protease FtsH
MPPDHGDEKPSLEAYGAPSRATRLRRAAHQWVVKQRRARASKSKGKGRMPWLLALSLLLLLGAFAWSLTYLQATENGQELTIDQVSALADEKRIETAEFLDEDSIVRGTFTAPEPEPVVRPKPVNKKDDNKKGDGQGGSANQKAAPKPKPKPEEESVAPPGSGSYWVELTDDGALSGPTVEMMTRAGATVSVDPQDTKTAVRIIQTFLLPLMILANLFALLFTASRGGGSGIGEVMMFGTISRGRHKGKASDAVSFDDVAGAEEAVAELKEVRDYLQDPERYERIGATPPKGVLLVGPPGCGKTLLAKAVAGEAEVPFFSVAGAEFVESLVGVGAARVRDLFQRVRAVAPAIVFIDELDAAARRRGHGGGSGGSDEREQTLNQILVEMDGFDVSSGVVVIGATNRPDILDPALLRPGRFDRHVTVDQPDHIGRMEILKLHARGKPVSDDVDFDYLARRTPGFSGADLASVLNEAALLTVREGKKIIEVPILEEAIHRVISGPKKKGRVLSEEERRRIAYHEAGHAVVAAATGQLGQLHRISILARAKGIGAASLGRTDAVLHTRSELFNQMVTAMAGLSAEVVHFGEPSTGAEADLEQATDVARDMVGRYGMGSRRRRLLAKEVDEYLGSEGELSQISEGTHEEMENEVDRLIADAETEATRLLKENVAILEELADELLEQETLEGAPLEKILHQVPGAAPGDTTKRQTNGAKTAGRSRSGSQN